MKLRIYKVNNRYAFNVGCFSSLHHSILIPEIKPTYEYAWLAYRDAKMVATKKSFHEDAIRLHKHAIEDLTEPVRADAKAEDLLITHYKTLLKDMSTKVEGIDDNSPDEKEMTYKVIKSQVEDLLRIKDQLQKEGYKGQIDAILNEYRKIAQQHFSDYLHKDQEEAEQAKEQALQQPQPPQEVGAPQEPNLTMASTKARITLTEAELMELLEHYGGKVCSAIAVKHPDAIYKIRLQDASFEILCLEKDHKPILRISVNENFQVNNIIPVGDMADAFPSYSSKFYQRYWKPIVESVGHFYVDDIDALILPEKTALPDMSEESKQCPIVGWEPKSSKEIPLSMDFKSKGLMWGIASAKNIVHTGSSYAEEDLLKQPTRVRCIDPQLQLYGKIGEVVQIIPVTSNDKFELDVNFGRKIVRLTKSQVEIVNDF